MQRKKYSPEYKARIVLETLLFLQENGIDNYDDLVNLAESVSGDFSNQLSEIKKIDSRLAEISALQKQVGTYRKTKKVYEQYKTSGWDRDFYESQRADIVLHRAAKKYFDDAGFGKNKKLPKITELKQEYAALLVEKKKLYSGYHKAKNASRELVLAKRNADKILGIKSDGAKTNQSRTRHERSER